MQLVSRPVERVHGCVRVPGDKSISHRAVMLGAVARGVTEVGDPVTWRDVCLTNRDRLLEAIADFETELKHLRRLVDDGNGAELEKLFRRARDYRRCLNAED